MFDPDASGHKNTFGKAGRGRYNKL